MIELKWDKTKKLLEESLIFPNLNFIGIHIKMFILLMKKVIKKLTNCLLTKLKVKNTKFLNKYFQ